MKFMTMMLKFYGGILASADFSAIEALADKYGFPIICVGILAWYIYKTHEEYRNDYKELHKTHQAEVKALTSALSDNTMVINRLCDTLDDCCFIDKEQLKGEE